MKTVVLVISLFFVCCPIKALADDFDLNIINSMEEIREYANKFKEQRLYSVHCENRPQIEELQQNTVFEMDSEYCQFWPFVVNNLSHLDSELARLIAEHPICVVRDRLSLAGESEEASGRVSNEPLNIAEASRFLNSFHRI